MQFEKAYKGKLKVVGRKELILTGFAYDESDLGVIEFLAQLKYKGDKDKIRKCLDRYKEQIINK